MIRTYLLIVLLNEVLLFTVENKISESFDLDLLQIFSDIVR